MARVKTETIIDPMIKGWKKSLPINCIDEELRDLVRVMNILPGIRTFECCIGHPPSYDPSMAGWEPARIWFECHPSTPVGLFVLTRATDRRYWRFGCCWSISLSASDSMQDGILPTTYSLRSESLTFGQHVFLTEKLAAVTARSLIENIWAHLVSKEGASFRKEYNLPNGEWWAKHWPKSVPGELTPEESVEVERASLEIDQRFFPESLEYRNKESV